MKSLLPLRNYGMDFRFSGNKGNIIGKAIDTRYSIVSKVSPLDATCVCVLTFRRDRLIQHRSHFNKAIETCLSGLAIPLGSQQAREVDLTYIHHLSSINVQTRHKIMVS